MSQDQNEIAIDVSGMTSREVNAQLRTLINASTSIFRVRMVGAEQQDNLITAIPPAQILISGNVGNFCAAALRNADVEILGNAETGIAHSLQSGVVTVHNNCSATAGAMAEGGLIVIHGNAGVRCGVGLNGADIVVEGSVGAYAGMYMRQGTIVVLGNVGPLAGLGSTGGTWFIQGEIDNPPKHLVESRLKDADKLRLGLLLLNSGMDANAKDFRKYVVDGQQSST